MDGGWGRIIAGDPAVLFAIFAAVAVFVWAFIAVRRMAGETFRVRRRVGELEIRLNEAETAIAAEAHVLVIWRGRDGIPERVMGSMHGAAQVPAKV
ncbi:MAG: hypothetical protein ACREDU_09145, partial [Methylocella sp.]